MQLLFKKPADTCHHSRASRETFHHYDKVIRVPDEAMTTPLQLLVQVISPLLANLFPPSLGELADAGVRQKHLDKRTNFGTL